MNVMQFTFLDNLIRANNMTGYNIDLETFAVTANEPISPLQKTLTNCIVPALIPGIIAPNVEPMLDPSLMDIVTTQMNSINSNTASLKDYYDQIGG